VCQVEGEKVKLPYILRDEKLEKTILVEIVFSGRAVLLKTDFNLIVSFDGRHAARVRNIFTINILLTSHSKI